MRHYFYNHFFDLIFGSIFNLSVSLIVAAFLKNIFNSYHYFNSLSYIIITSIFFFTLLSFMFTNAIVPINRLFQIYRFENKYTIVIRPFSFIRFYRKCRKKKICIRPILNEYIFDCIVHLAYITPDQSLYECNTWLVKRKNLEKYKNQINIKIVPKKERKVFFDNVTALFATGKKVDLSEHDFYKIIFNKEDIDKILLKFGGSPSQLLK